MRSLACLLLVVGCSVGESGPPGGQTPDSANPMMIDAPPQGGAGTLQITFTATTSNGPYSPKNIDAVWIESGGTFVKTIGRWAATRKQHLVAWNTAAGANDADAVSGATQNTYAPLSLTWDLKNKQGTVVADGMYTVRMESTDLNATTAGQNHQGTFTFMKGATAQMQTGLTNGGFVNVSINFTP